MPSVRSGSFQDLEDGFEIDQYVDALGESSSRVRLVMLAIIIASIAALATLLSERQHAWELSRLQEFGQDYALVTNNGAWACPEHVESVCQLCNVHAHLVHNEGLTNKTFNFCALNPAFCPGDYANEDENIAKDKDAYALKHLCDAVNRLKGRGIVSKMGAENFAEKQWEAFINNVTYVRSPVLGFVFDINDLGLLTGATFFILMWVMFYYSNRAHENLALSMWKVRGIVKKESCYDDPGSKANLLYHALAMQQVFTVPPTLARWNDLGLFRKSHYLLFLLPSLVQSLVLMNDWQSRGKGFEVNVSQTWLSLALQAGFLFVVLAIALACIAHLHADDRLWEDVFLYINPRHKLMAKPLWRHWLKIADNHPPAWGLAVRQAGERREILFLDSIHGSLLQLSLYATPNMNVLPVSDVRKIESTRARGLYLNSAGKERLYSKERPTRRFPAVSGRSRLLPVQDTAFARETEIEILYNLVPGLGEIHLSKRRLMKTGPEGYERVWSLGGMPHQTDGFGRQSGFAAIHAIIADGDSLFITDGGCVRKIEPDGRIITWGGQPLGGYLRPERSLLLGLALVRDEAEFDAQERCRTAASVSPRILVCDFTLRRVFGIGGDGTTVWELYRSDRGWAPTGIAIDGNTVYLLEYRSDTAIGEWINYILKICWPRLWIRSLLPFWRFLRILRFNQRSFKDPAVVFELTHFDWSRARK